ncbi:MAG: hypothetical protein H7836_04450 [Magnetococcus sp. YQC-3]
MSWQDERKQIRRTERLLRKEYNQMEQKNLKTELQKVIPPYMMPGNVGSFTKVTWPFWYNVSFDFGANPSWSSNTRQTQSFQVSQEAAFLLAAVSRKSYSYTTASELAPLQFEIRDRQSSRQLNDRPIPLQMIGKRSKPTILPTAMLIMPNAFLDVTMTSWLPSTVTQASTGTGKFQISFFGYRVRVEDADKVLSSVFG